MRPLDVRGVIPVVVRHVAAAPHHDPIAPLERWQDLVLIVEERGAPDAEEKGRRGLRDLAGQRVNRSDQPFEVLLDQRAFLEPRDALIPLEAAELEEVGMFPDRGEHLAPFVEGPHAGPPSLAPSLEEDPDRAPGLRPLHVAHEVLDPLGAVEDAVDLERRIGLHRGHD